MEIVKALEGIGFYKVEEELPELLKRVDVMSAAAGDRSVKERFEALPSFIPAGPPQKRHDHICCIDIGGAFTRVGLRQVEGEDRARWKMLFEADNAEFKTEAAAEPFTFFAAQLAGRVADTLRTLGIRRRDVEACGVVWGNPLENKPVSGRGIMGSIVHHAQYLKGEWFLAGLHDGYEVGKVLLKALDDAGVHIKKFIIGNDTPLTMKALTFADAGMVASSGVNGTLVKSMAEVCHGASDERVICNAEMGMRISIPSSLLSRADLIADRKIADTLELLSSGTFLPRLFCQYVTTLAHRGVSDLVPLSERLQSLGVSRWNAFETLDMACLIYNAPAFLARRADPELYTEAVLARLGELSRELVVRAAKLCALVAYGTVCGQLGGGDNFTVALDSRLAREMPLFLEVLRDTLTEFTPRKRFIELALVEPLLLGGGQISVPMQGAANALDSLIV